MKNFKKSLIPKTGEKMMTFKFSIFAAGLFAVTLLSLSMSSLASAADFNKDDPKMQEAIDQGPTTQAVTGGSVDCPTGNCFKNNAPGFANDGPAIEPADAAAAAKTPGTTKTTK